MPLLRDVTSILLVRLGETVVGLPATAVHEIVRAVAIGALPGAPPIVEGALNLRGRLVPVVDVRARLGLAASPLDPDQFLVVLALGDRLAALRVDDVDDLVELEAGAVASPVTLSPALRGLAGLAARADGSLVVYDPAAFVTQAEGEAVDAALAGAA